MSKKFEKIVVHMGPQKTGSSSIQKFYFENRTIIAAESGVYYPSFKQNHGVNIRAAFNDLKRYRATLNDDSKNLPNKDLHKKARETIEKELLSTTHKQVFISGESISLFDPEQLREFHTWLKNYTDNIQLFGFVRHPMDWYESLVSEKVKQGESLESAMISSSDPVGFRVIFENMAVEFGKHNIEIFDIERERNNSNYILECVHSKLGINQEVIEKCVPLENNQNARISMESAHLLSSLNNERPLYTDGFLNPKRSLNDVIELKKISGKPFYLSVDQLQNLKQKAAYEIKWLSDHHGIHYTNDRLINTDTDITGHLFSDQAILDIASLISDLTLKVQNLNHITNTNKGLDTTTFQKNEATLKLKLEKMQTRADTLNERLKVENKDRIENFSVLYKILRPLFNLEKRIKNKE